MKACKGLWEAGFDVSVEDCRKWLNFDVELRGIEEFLPKEPSWKPIVILNQVLQATSDEDVVRRLLEKYREAPFRMVVYLRKYFPKAKDTELVLSLPVEKDPDFVNTTKGIVDFFLNYLRFEEGVDVDGLVEPLKKLLEKDQNVEEFLRLCGIDELVQAGEFLERVERAVDVFVKAKEQGLDLEEILRKWDELANGGGSRFGYLEEAVKAVADEEVGRKFWEEVERVLGEKGIKVSGTGDPRLAYRLFYLELVNLDEKVDLTPMSDVLEDLSTFFKKIRPIPLFTAEDIEKTFEMIGVNDASTGEEVKRTAKVLSLLDRYTSTYVFDKGLKLYDLVKESEEPPEKVAEIVSRSVREGVSEGLEGETLVEYIKKRLGS